MYHLRGEGGSLAGSSVTPSQVWTVRLDLHVLCHEGSLADACSVAGLAALAHFRRPDVTLKVTRGLNLF